VAAEKLAPGPVGSEFDSDSPDFESDSELELTPDFESNSDHWQPEPQPPEADSESRPDVSSSINDHE
jgi:hypothetical protein